MTENVIALARATTSVNLNVNLDWQTILIWAIVGLVAGFLASHVMLGHGMGLVGDIIVGIIGALIGGWIFNAFGHVGMTGFNAYSIIVAFVGGVVFLWILRMMSGTRGTGGRVV